MRLSLFLTLTLTIGCVGLTALFLFFLAKTALAYLLTAYSVTSRPLFPFQQVQYAQVFLLKPAPFCKLIAGLGSINKFAISLHFSYLTLALSSAPSFFYFKLSRRICLLSPPVLSGYNGSPHSFLPENEAADDLARRGALLVPYAILCSLSPLTSRIYFSRTRGVLSHQNSLTHRFPRFPPRNLCSLVTLAVFSLVYAATNTAYC